MRECCVGTKKAAFDSGYKAPTIDLLFGIYQKSLYEKLEDSKRVIRTNLLKKDRQYSDQKRKKDKKPNDSRQQTTQLNVLVQIQ